VLGVMGLSFSFSLDWMFLADPADLEQRLLATVWDFHAFPPGMNVLSGVLLKLAPEHAPLLARLCFEASGLTLVLSLHYLSRALGVSRRAALWAAFGFCLLPQTLYLEHLYLYDYPAAALLMVLVALLHRGLSRPSRGVFVALFFVAAVLVWLRSAFHLVWFGAVLLVVVLSVPRAFRRNVLLAAIVPALLGITLYVKNWVRYGVFGATSWGGANVAAATTGRLAPEIRREWVKQGRVSPYAELSVFAPPSAYRRFFGSSESERYPELSALERPTLRSPNYNHWFYLEVNPVRAADARHYILSRPGEYLGTVLGTNLPQFFAPSTRWHPRDHTPSSPHHAHRQLLGGYERAYAAIVHGLPFSPFGLYLLLPFLLFASVRHALRLSRSDRRAQAGVSAEAVVLAFAVFQIVFVTAVSVCFTYAETSRYRFLIEPLIYLLLVSYVARRYRRRTAPEERKMAGA
jgi:4-amino-4-deoxy-L-arabinose transferase-like glycosyltransferase